MGLAPTWGAAPGDRASHPPANCQRLPAQVAQALLCPKTDPPRLPGMDSSLRTGQGRSDTGEEMP